MRALDPNDDRTFDETPTLDAPLDHVPDLMISKSRPYPIGPHPTPDLPFSRIIAHSIINRMFYELITFSTS